MGVERLAKALVARGHEVTVIHDIDGYLTLAGSEPTAEVDHGGVNVIGLRSKFNSLSNLLTHQLSRPTVHHKRLQEILAPGAFDIIWYNNVSLVGGAGVLAYGDGLKIYEAHEHWLVCPTHVLWRNNRELCDKRECFRCGLSYHRPPQLWRHLPAFQKNLTHVDRFIAKSEFSRAKHAEFGFPKPMTVVPYFLPDEPVAATEGPSPQDRPYFLFVGRLEKIKGLDDVMPNFRDYEDADLLIIGSGDYENELKRQAADIPRVKFLGRMAPEELSRYYAHAIALIVPSVCYETFGIILIESFRMGTPVIARDIGPFSEIVMKSGGGVIYTDDSRLGEVFKPLQHEAGRRDALAKAALSGFHSHWSEEVVINQYFTTLRETALEKGRKDVAAALED